MMMLAVKTADRLATRFLWIAKATVMIGMLFIAIMAFDRKPPFEILEVPPVATYPGHDLTMTVKVRRDAGRNCDAHYTRYLFSSSGVRYDLSTSWASDAMIDSLEREYPGEMRIAIRIPVLIDRGQARLESVLVYRCNKVHAIWPIVVTTSIPFTIL